MVKAILDGTKTQTRRIFEGGRYSKSFFPFDGDFDDDNWPMACHRKSGCLTRIECPYGQPGDRLWVRETWQTHCDLDHIKPSDLPVGAAIQYTASYDGWVSKKRPSIFMPRWASRITLEIKAVRVERLHALSIEDAKAEGVHWENAIKDVFGEVYDRHPIQAFELLWESINGKTYPWESNPWLWVIEFEKL